MEEYPKNLMELEQRFSTEEACRDYRCGGEKPGKRGRGAMGKTLVVIAAQEDGEATGRIRPKQVVDASAESLEGAVLETIESGSVIKTDGWDGYNGLRSLGYNRLLQKCRCPRPCKVRRHDHWCQMAHAKTQDVGVSPAKEIPLYF